MWASFWVTNLEVWQLARIDLEQQMPKNLICTQRLDQFTFKTVGSAFIFTQITKIWLTDK